MRDIYTPPNFSRWIELSDSSAAPFVDLAEKPADQVWVRAHERHTPIKRKVTPVTTNYDPENFIQPVTYYRPTSARARDVRERLERYGHVTTAGRSFSTTSGRLRAEQNHRRKQRVREGRIAPVEQDRTRHYAAPGSLGDLSPGEPNMTIPHTSESLTSTREMSDRLREQVRVFGTRKKQPRHRNDPMMAQAMNAMKARRSVK